MSPETPDSVVLAVLAYLRVVHDFLDWAPVGAVPKRVRVIAWQTETARLRAHRQTAT